MSDMMKLKKSPMQSGVTKILPLNLSLILVPEGGIYPPQMDENPVAGTTNYIIIYYILL